MLVSWLESEHVQTINYWLTTQPHKIIAQQHVVFTESAHWADSVSKLQCPSIVCLCLYLHSLKHLITTIYERAKVKLIDCKENPYGQVLKRH